MTTSSTIPDGQAMLDWLCSTYLVKDTPETTSTRQTATGAAAGGSGSNALLHRARAYVERSANVSEGGRNKAAFSLSGHLWAMQGESGERLSDADVFDLLTDWNQRNSPPLSDSELQRTIRNGRDRGTPPPPKLPETRAAAEPVGNRSGVVQQQQLATAADYEPRRPFSLGQTMQNPEPLHEPILNGLLRRGESMNLVAAPKTGKSWLVTQMALSVATGRLWIGFSTTPGKVLLVDNELHRATLEHRFQTVAEAMDVDLQAAEQNLLALCLRGDLAGGLMQLELDLQQFTPGELNLLIVDAKYRLDGAQDENSNAEQTAFFNRVDQLAARLDCAVVLVHHASKGLQTGKHVTDVGAGAGAQSRAADVHFVIRPHEQPGMAVVDAVCRSFRPVESLTLRHEWPLWKITLGVEPVLKAEQTRGDRRQAAKDQDGIEQLARVLRRVGEPIARNALKTEAGMGPERLNRLIAKMRDEDQMTISTTTHTNGTTIELFSLTEPAEQDDPEAPSEIHRPPSDLFSDAGS